MRGTLNMYNFNFLCYKTGIIFRKIYESDKKNNKFLDFFVEEYSQIFLSQYTEYW